MTDQTKPRTNPLFISSIKKAFSVIEAFDLGAQSLSLTEISKKTKLNKSAAQRYIHTLEELGYIEKNEMTKEYRLTIKNIFPASVYFSGNQLIHLASPYILQLRKKFNARFGMSVLFDNKVVYLIALLNNQRTFHSDYPGFHVPVYCTSSGRMFMSYEKQENVVQQLKQTQRVALTHATKTSIEEILHEINIAQKQNYCITDEEYTLGHINLSVPIFKSPGQIIACLVAVVQKSELNMQQFTNEILPEMQETARIISTSIGSQN